MEIGLLGAFVGGILTLLSPCSVMLLPAFFSYAFSSPKILMARTGQFYMGLITTLVPLGVLAGTVGAFVSTHRFTFVNIAAGIVVVLGLVMLLGIQLPFMGRSQRGLSGATPLAVYMLGTVYGLAGVCAGPLLGAVLTVAAVTGNALFGGITLLLFAAGMTLPLLILAFVWGTLPIAKRLVRPREIKVGPWRNTWTGLISGILTVGLGILLIVTNGTSSLGGLFDASTQVQLEGKAYQALQNVPDVMVLIVVAAIALIALFIARKKMKQASHAEVVSTVSSGSTASSGSTDSRTE